MSRKAEEAISIFKKAGGVLRMSEALEKGIHRSDLYLLRDSGQLEVVDRGLYQLITTDLPHQDFMTVAKRVPKGVICLISALNFYEITTQFPHFVYLAIPSDAHKPAIQYPPLKCFWYSDRLLETGVVEHAFDGCVFKIFDIEKTLVDCVKFRNKIGLDVALEALNVAFQKKRVDVNKLLRYAKMFRVETVLRPIIQTIMNG